MILYDNKSFRSLCKCTGSVFPQVEIHEIHLLLHPKIFKQFLFDSKCMSQRKSRNTLDNRLWVKWCCRWFQMKLVSNFSLFFLIVFNFQQRVGLSCSRCSSCTSSGLASGTFVILNLLWCAWRLMCHFRKIWIALLCHLKSSVSFLHVLLDWQSASGCLWLWSLRFVLSFVSFPGFLCLSIWLLHFFPRWFVVPKTHSVFFSFFFFQSL